MRALQASQIQSSRFGTMFRKSKPRVYATNQPTVLVYRAPGYFQPAIKSAK